VGSILRTFAENFGLGYGEIYAPGTVMNNTLISRKLEDINN
jgi:hypothetical protein